MRRGDRVKTECGIGTIRSRENETGNLRNRFLVTLDEPEKMESYIQRNLHKKYCGLYFRKDELEKAEE